MGLLFAAIIPVLVSVLVALAAFLAGRFVLGFIKVDNKVIAFLIGYGLIGYLAVFLNIFGPLKQWVLIVLLLAVLALGWRHLVRLFRDGKNAVRVFNDFKAGEKLISAAIILAFLFYLLSALTPPYRTDALAYHLPEAMRVAQGGLMTVGGYGDFIGNSPKLMESLYGLLYALAGQSAASFPLMSLAHYIILLAGFSLIFSFLKREQGRTAGLLSVLFLFALYELLVNATSAYVDAATAVYQVAGVLFVYDWLREKDRKRLIVAGLLFGLALATKYLAIYALPLVALVFLYELWRRADKNLWLGDIFYFTVPLFLFSAFWYLKNWVVLGNPVYPFIFGHEGITEASFQSAVVAVTQFRPRTVWNFLSFPFLFFSSAYYLPAMAGIVISPLALLIGRGRDFLRYLFCWLAAYCALWFFFISHQPRFVFVALILAMMLAASFVVWLAEKFEKIFSSKIFLAALIVVMLSGAYVIASARDGYLLQVKKAEVLYAAGFEGAERFYERKNMGEVFRLSRYINESFSDITFLSLWSDTNFFLEKGNYFFPPADFYGRAEVDEAWLLSYLEEKGFRYVITLSPAERERVLASPEYTSDLAGLAYREAVIRPVLIAEELLGRKAEIVYNHNDRVIYRINY